MFYIFDTLKNPLTAPAPLQKGVFPKTTLKHASLPNMQLQKDNFINCNYG
jgi:hypothetical protein